MKHWAQKDLRLQAAPLLPTAQKKSDASSLALANRHYLTESNKLLTWGIENAIMRAELEIAPINRSQGSPPAHICP